MKLFQLYRKSNNAFMRVVQQHAAKPKLVSGANRDTSSQVVFGDPQQGDRFFETTHNATYTNQQLPERKKMESDNYKSSVPVDYYKGLYQTHFIFFEYCFYFVELCLNLCRYV